MSQIEREVKILNIDVKKIKDILMKNNIKPKFTSIQEICAFDMPNIYERYNDYVDRLLKQEDDKPLLDLLDEIDSCITKTNLEKIIDILGKDIKTYIKDNKNLELLKDDKLISVIKEITPHFCKWMRIRKTNDKTMIAIKSIIDGQGEYNIDDVREFEMEVPSFKEGIELLNHLGFYHQRHQVKMRIAYDYKNTEIVIDKWPMLNPYIEVEGNTKEDIDETVKMLGFDPEDEIVINTDDVYKMIGIDIYSKENKDVTFSKKELEEIDKYLK